MMTDKQKGYIQKLKDFAKVLRAETEGLTEEQLTTVYIPNEWTVAQNIHHIADGNYNKYHTIRQILTEREPHLETLPQEVFTNLPDAKSKDIAGSLEIIEGLHKRAVYLLEHLSTQQWQKVGIHPRTGKITIEEIVETFSTHGERHIVQMKKTLAAA